MTAVLKSIDKMTHEEKIALTEEQLDAMVLLECAEQGVKLLPEPEPFNQIVVPKSQKYFNVGGHVCTLTEEAANEIQAVLVKHQAELVKTAYNWQTGYSNLYLEADTAELTVTPTYCYDKATIKAQESLLTKQKEKEEYYKKAKSAYDKAREEQLNVRNSIYADYYEALHLEREVKLHQDMFAEYIRIANGDRKQAVAFFQKANKDLDRSVLTRVAPEFHPEQEAVSA